MNFGQFIQLTNMNKVNLYLIRLNMNLWPMILDFSKNQSLLFVILVIQAVSFIDFRILGIRSYLSLNILFNISKS